MNASPTVFRPAEHSHRRLPIQPFRPLFFCALAFASLGMGLWAVFLHLGWLPATRLPALLWHGHEMLLGFGGALVGGFLLTASANWTGLPTTNRGSLTALTLLWLAARLGLLLGVGPLWLAAACDIAYFLLLAVLVGRVILLRRNRRNGFVVGILLLLAALDAAFYRGAVDDPTLASHALLWCIDLLTLLMLVIGGRVIPFFTRRAITGCNSVDHKPLLLAVNLGALLALLLDVAAAPAALRGAVWLALAMLIVLRVAGWNGWACRRAPMLWVLHLGYLWLAIGSAVRGLGLVGVLHQPELSTLHGLTVGALGTLALGMMTRVTQGHSGAAISASRWQVAAFLLPSAAALLRLAGGPTLWPAAATLWALAYLIGLLTLAPLLWCGTPAVP